MVVKLTSAKKVEGAATITKAVVDAKSKQIIAEDQHQEAVPMKTEVQMAAQPWCEVGFEASFTKNLGNYQSARLNVIVKIPCPAGDIDEVFDYARTWVNGKLETLVSEL
jgi:hypothetical protein